jgi:hypothetical protein
MIWAETEAFMRAGRGIIALALVVAVGACASNDEPRLMNIAAATDRPDEFAIVPNKPLETPEDMAALPEPTPGGANRVDQTPLQDAVAALGGNAGAASRGGVPATDGAIVAHATRLGSNPGIRQQLAAEDLEYRRRNDGRLLERLFSVNVYYKAYRPMSLDQHAELERWRRAGARNVGAPPDPSL